MIEVLMQDVTVEATLGQAAVIEGDIVPEQYIEATVQVANTYTGPRPVTSVNGVKPNTNGDVDIDPIIDAKLRKTTFSGEYVVIPSPTDDVVFLTAQKYMNSNIRVNKIPYAEVSNNSGGMTVTIGGD